MKHKRASRVLKVGHVYSIDFNDHYTAEKVSSADPAYDTPVVLRATGKLVKITPTQLNLEYARRLDGDAADYSHNIFVVMKPDVVAVHDFGPDRRKK